MPPLLAARQIGGPPKADLFIYKLPKIDVVYVTPVRTRDARRELQKLNEGKATGPDGVSAS